jgi:hypothetical protein
VQTKAHPIKDSDDTTFNFLLKRKVMINLLLQSTFKICFRP